MMRDHEQIMLDKDSREDLFHQAEKLHSMGNREDSFALYIRCLQGLKERSAFPSLPKCLRAMASRFVENNDFIKAIQFVQAERLYYEAALFDIAALQHRLTVASDRVGVGGMHEAAQTFRPQCASCKYPRLDEVLRGVEGDLGGRSEKDIVTPTNKDGPVARCVTPQSPCMSCSAAASLDMKCPDKARGDALAHGARLRYGWRLLTAVSVLVLLIAVLIVALLQGLMESPLEWLSPPVASDAGDIDTSEHQCITDTGFCARIGQSYRFLLVPAFVMKWLRALISVLGID